MARALAIERLRAAGLWLDQRRLRLIQGDQSARGAAYVERVLVARLDPADMARLRSGALFGRSASDLPRRAAIVAGFGRELGYGLARLEGASASERNFDVCSSFMLGTALFDRLCDAGPESAAALLAAFDPPALQLMMADPVEGGAQLRRSEAAGMAEFRLVFALIEAVFRGLHDIGAGADVDLQALILRCYLSQAGTVALPNCKTATTDVGDKNRLPFMIVARMVRCGDATAPGAVLAAKIAAATGELFWRIDDLADLADDLAYESTNDLVRRAIAEGAPPGDEAGHLLRSTLLADAVGRMCDELGALLARLKPAAVRMDGSWSFESWILAAVRGWLDGPGRS